jgi:hypothetical protein
VNEPELAALGASTEARLDLPNDRNCSQGGYALTHLECDETGMLAGEAPTRLMGDGRVRPGLASRPRSPSAPLSSPERQLALLRPTH